MPAQAGSSRLEPALQMQDFFEPARLSFQAAAALVECQARYLKVEFLIFFVIIYFLKRPIKT